MEILLVNNNTLHLPQLKKGLTGHTVEIQKYQPGMDFHWQGKDLVILSGGGGEGMEIDDNFKPGHLWYEDQIKFVKTCPTPMLGICMGFEIIARAHGADIPKMSSFANGIISIKTTARGRRSLNLGKFKQTVAHDWHVKSPPAGFKVLAESDYGIELIKKRNITACQFHPEEEGTLSLPNLIQAI